MRTTFGWTLAVLGLLCAVLGAVVMVVLGPDSRFSTGPHAVDTDGVAVVTAPRAIRWADVRVDVLAEVPVRKPIFVGLANSVDVQDLVGGTARLEITRFRTPWRLTTRDVKGRPNLPGAPTALDWWLTDSAGLGGASISADLPGHPVSLAILSVGSTNLSGLRVTLAYGVRGGFVKGAGLVLLGLGALVLARVLTRRRGETDALDGLGGDDEDVGDAEDVVYVYVDDDGVEHAVAPEELGDFEIVDDDEEDRS